MRVRLLENEAPDQRKQRAELLEAELALRRGNFFPKRSYAGS